jgi:hypothetical protein
MTEQNSIFFNVVTHENQATELFRNFLRYKAFRDMFLGLFLLKDEFDLIEDSHIQTQYNSCDFGRPDILIENGAIEAIIEVKINETSLTEHQPKSYLRLLSKDALEKGVNPYLIFLVPENYDLQEFNNRINSSYNENGSLNIGKSNIKIVHWEQLIRNIERNNLSMICPLLKEYSELLKAWYITEPITFSASEVYSMFHGDKHIPIIISKLYKTVDGIREKISKTYIVKNIVDDIQYALDIRDRDGNYLLYFGVWFDFWKEYGFPLCYGVGADYSSREMIEIFKSEAHFEMQDKSEMWYMRGIQMEVYDDSVCIENIQGILEKDILKLINKNH